MPFVAESSRSIAAPPEAVFDKLADVHSWRAWMPRSFRPLGRARGPLRVGGSARVRIAGAAPAKLVITTLARPREITWCGGIPGLVRAEHRFLFEPDGTGTLARSVETWSGPLAALTRPALRLLAERIGAQQLEALARAVERG